MFNIFKHDKHGIWLKNEDAEVVLIENSLVDYAEEFLTMHLIFEEVTRRDAEQISNTIIKYRDGIIAI